MQLSEQCEQLGLPYQRVELARGSGGWIVKGAEHKRPEEAAAALMRAEGWICSTCEGGPMLLLMKAACLELLISLNRFGGGDSLTRFFEAQVTINRQHRSEIAQAIGAADTSTVVRNFQRIYATDVCEYYPGVSEELIEQLHIAISSKLPAIFNRFSADAYCYRAGWPDVTAVRTGEVRFREVKTSDKLHGSQFETIREVLQPCGLTTDVIQLVKKSEATAF
jgi:hypothetical protein